MSDDYRSDARATPDISLAAPKQGVNWLFLAVVSGSAFSLIVFLTYFDLSLWWFLVLVPLAMLAFCGWLAWMVLVKRGALTWMRLAQVPARLMAQGNAAGAEAACSRALLRARRFGSVDHRRGMMLGELALFVWYQGRSMEAFDLFAESTQILARGMATEPMDYFIILNNYGICLIHIRDHDAAQKTLERAVDLTFAIRKDQANRLLTIPLERLQLLQLVLHLNLAFLSMEMGDLQEAEIQLREADALVRLLPPAKLGLYRDHYFAICAAWELEAGNFQLAEEEIARAPNPEYLACLRVRARLHIHRGEFAQAEALQRQYWDGERKRGTLHRPDMVKQKLEFAEALFGQSKHDEAFASVEEARAIFADFALPIDRPWQEALAVWLPRARDHAKTDLAAALEADVHKPLSSEQRIIIREKLRLRRE